jgi:hypothetical protein
MKTKPAKTNRERLEESETLAEVLHVLAGLHERAADVLREKLEQDEEPIRRRENDET